MLQPIRTERKATGLVVTPMYKHVHRREQDGGRGATAALGV